MPGPQGRMLDSRHFAMVPRNEVPRSAFDMVFSHKTTFDAGYLVPIYLEEILPGDSFRVKMTAFARLATPLTPVMDNLVLESFFFFVPNRLVWDNWQRFMGEKASPSDTTTFLVPQITIGPTYMSALQPSNYDYMGVTNNGKTVGASRTVSALPFRALVKIWNEWFRDRDIDNPIFEESGDGPDDAYVADYLGPFLRRKRHDYFTSARPWPQAPINIDIFSDQDLGPIGRGTNMTFPWTGVPVSGIGVEPSAAAGGTMTTIEEAGGRQPGYPTWFRSDTTQIYIQAEPIGATTTAAPAIRVLINDIRTANTVQLMQERNARGGTRYTEIIRSHFGVTSPDARLQRPEYLGGGRSFVTVNPVAQQSATGLTGGSTVLGELAGIGTAVVRDHGFTSSFTEHGYVIGLVSVRADISYQQGIDRHWFRRTQFDFYWPGLAHLGEQAILSHELFADLTIAGDTDVFGYQERWSEYRTKTSKISGRFRSTTAMTGGPLDIWHFAQEFTARPALNTAFLQENVLGIDRVLQVGGAPAEQFLFDSVFDIRAVRCMPMFSVPGLGPRL